MTDRAVADDPMRWHFHPIISPRAHEEVVGQIAFAILSGAYAPSERLPHIEKLSSSMNVSKPVVGEALKLLTKAGVVQTRRGANGGLTVTTNQVPDEIMTLVAPLRHLGVQEIVEARHPIELRLALLAAERASESDFSVMQSCIDELRAHKQSELAVRIRFDHLFHYTIGRTAKSSALALYQHQILEHLFVRMRSYFADIEDVDDVVTVHQQTLEAIRSGNRARIVGAIADHLRPLELAVAAMQAGAGPTRRRTRAKNEGAGRPAQKRKEQNV